MHEQGVVVAEYRLALFKRNTMLSLVDGAFSFVPCEPNWIHAYIVVTLHLPVKVPVTAQRMHNLRFTWRGPCPRMARDR